MNDIETIDGLVQEVKDLCDKVVSLQEKIATTYVSDAFIDFIDALLDCVTDSASDLDEAVDVCDNIADYI